MGSTLADHHQALRKQIAEQREALAELDELLQSSTDDSGEIQQVNTCSHILPVCPLVTVDLTYLPAPTALSDYVHTIDV